MTLPVCGCMLVDIGLAEKRTLEELFIVVELLRFDRLPIVLSCSPLYAVGPLTRQSLDASQPWPAKKSGCRIKPFMSVHAPRQALESTALDSLRCIFHRHIQQAMITRTYLI